ncbi:Hsp70 family protein [Granulicella arctica]|uniref:Hsp70 family protein n=1 Tax=Granulicella arctica TaxID=940613 RepID=UPI0021E00BAA|nr:Hsp70 family protein [Granulicella arctica]
MALTVVPPVMQIGNVAPPVSILIHNRSCAELRIDRWETPSWIVLGDGPKVLAPGEVSKFGAKANTISLRQSNTGPVAVHTNAGAAMMLVIAMEERPSIVCVPAELEVWRVPDGEMPAIPVKLAPTAGFLRVRGVRSGGSSGLEVLSRLDDTFMASEGDGVAITLRALVDRFQHQPSASLLVEFDGPHGVAEVEVSVKVAVRNPPEICWDGEHHSPAEVYQSTAQRLEFVLANRSPGGRDGGARNGRVQIKSVILEPLEQLNISIRLVSRMPLTLRGGESGTVVFEVNLSEAPVRSNSPLQFRLRAQANGPALDKPVSVFVRALPQYDGILAIDFGSSNTCCAVIETGRESERLKLDGSSVASPTIVRYLDLAGAEPEVEIGTRVQELVSKDEQVAASAIDGLKQRLGDERQRLPVRPSKSTDWTTRTATQAASDYLREVRRMVELNKTTVFGDFILTHPAVCSLRQYRNLHRALMWGFGAGAREVRFLQEPIAALVPFMAKQARNGELAAYTVASFDLGGGTTDIAAVRVEYVPLPGGRLEIRPQIRYSRGIRFGGEDLTKSLVSELETRLNRLISQSEPCAVLVREGTQGASTEDVLLNGYKLRQAADTFKVSLSDEGKREEPARLIMRMMAPGGLVAKDFDRGFSDLNAAGDTDLETLFLDDVRRRVKDAAKLLHAASIRAGHLDVIQVSGKTAYLPVVLETIALEFRDSKVVRADDPKECVVTGACLSRSMGRGAAVRLVLPDAARRTTSSIGMYDATTSKFSIVLPVDAGIPNEGLTGEVPNGWFGFERVVIWENLGIDDDELRNGGSALLSKLGTWVPDRPEPGADSEGWTLRLVLRNFTLSVMAIGPEAEIVTFTRLGEADEF